MEILKDTISINQELVNKLTKREFEVALLIIEGETTGAISQKLVIKPNTVSTLKKMIFLKLGINSEIALYKVFRENNYGR